MKKLIIALVIIGMVIAISGKFMLNKIDKQVLIGNKNVVKIEQKLDNDIKEIIVEGVPNLILSQDKDHSDKVTFEIDDNLMKNIEMRNENGILSIKVKRGISIKDFKAFSTCISFKDVSSIKVSGVGQLSSNSPINLKLLVMKNSGSGQVLFENINVDNLELDVAGVGMASFQGTAENCSMNISSVGNFDSQKLKTGTLHVNANSSGSVGLNAEKELYITAKSTPNINYSGNAKIKTQELKDSNLQKSGIN
jgi:hypothetical protein